jgi:hypothetical protein
MELLHGFWETNHTKTTPGPYQHLLLRESGQPHFSAFELCPLASVCPSINWATNAHVDVVRFNGKCV